MWVVYVIHLSMVICTYSLIPMLVYMYTCTLTHIHTHTQLSVDY